MKITESDDFFQAIQKLQNISFYPIHIFYKSMLIYPQTPDLNTDPFSSDPALFRNLSKKSGIFQETDSTDIFYAISAKGDYICIVGPLCFQSLSRNQMLEYAHKHTIKSKFEFRIPRCSTMQALDTLSLISLLLEKTACNISNQGDGSADSDASLLEETDKNTSALWIYSEAEDSGNSLSDERSYYLQAYQLDNTEKDIPHTPYALEMEIISALQTSDKEKFYSLLNEITQYSSGDFANTSSKYKEYSAVSIITILTRAAITAGVSQSEAYSLSDLLLYKTSACNNEQTYIDIFKEALKSFFELIKKSNEIQNQSIYIRDCKAYIGQNLNKELNPEIIANHLGISKNYLLQLFPQYENITLMQYILRERVQAAANMLKYSDFDIMRIASYFHFQTQSHFGVVFKKYIGMTPAAYRKKNKPAEF